MLSMLSKLEKLVNKDYCDRFVGRLCSNVTPSLSSQASGNAVMQMILTVWESDTGLYSDYFTLRLLAQNVYIQEKFGVSKIFLMFLF